MDSELSCIWRDRKFVFEGRRIKWSEIGDHSNFANTGYRDLPTHPIWKVEVWDFGRCLCLFTGTDDKWLLRPTKDVMVIEAEQLQ